MAVIIRPRPLPLSTTEARQLEVSLRALGDVTRLKVIALLTRGEMCVCELIPILELPQNLVSHHLGVLRQQGLVKERHDPNDARVIYYSLNEAALTKLKSQLIALLDLSQLDATPACCVDQKPLRRYLS